MGIAAGVLCKVWLGDCEEDQPLPDVVKLLAFPGQLWVRALKLMVVPMIFTSMVCSTSAANGLGSTNAMASLAVRFYLATTVVAALTGIILFNLFSGAFIPIVDSAGGGANTTAEAAGDEGGAASTARLTTLDTLLRFGFDLVPDNLVGALLHSQLLSVITFGLFFGAMLDGAPHARLLAHCFEATFATFVSMILVVVLFTPIGVASLVAASIATSSQLLRVLPPCGKTEASHGRPAPCAAVHWRRLVRRLVRQP